MRERKDFKEFNIQTAANIAAGTQWAWRGKNPETIEDEQTITRDLVKNGAEAVNEVELFLKEALVIYDLKGGVE